MSRTVGVLGAVAAATLLGAGVAHAVPQQVDFTCEASTGLGPVAATFGQAYDGSAPETVAPGGDLTVSVIPQPNTIPATSNGLPVTSVGNFSWTVPVPANSTLVSASLSGGEGLPGTPQLTVGTDRVVVTLAESLPGGATFTFPTVTMNLTAGASGTIEVKTGGTSLTDPGLTFTAIVDLLGSPLTAQTACYPNPNPVLASTAITA